MKAQTGIVMKIEKNTAVVMKNGGEFVSLPANRSWKTGEVILLPEKRRSLRPFYTAAACLALVFTLGAGSFHYYYAQTSLCLLYTSYLSAGNGGVYRESRLSEYLAGSLDGSGI